MTNFFAGCFTPAEIKARYRRLAKEYHPDRSTGDIELFRAMAAEYEALQAGKVLPKVWGKVKRRNAIRKLVRLQQDKQLKKMFVFHAYRKTLAENGQELTRLDLEVIAGMLEFRSGWIEIICKENKII